MINLFRAAIFLGFVSLSSFAVAEDVVVSTTVYPMTLAVQDIANGYVEAFTIVTPGSDPHTTALLPSAVARASRSAGIFSFHNVELNQSLESVGPVVTVFGQGTHDWLNIPRMISGGERGVAIIDGIMETLCIIEPKGCKEFRSRSDEIKARIKATVESCVQSDKETLFVTTHPSWEALLNGFGFTNIVPLFDTRGETVLPQSLKKAQSKGADAKRVIFIADPDTEEGLKAIMHEDLHAHIVTLDETGSSAKSLVDFYAGLCKQIQSEVRS